MEIGRKVPPVDSVAEPGSEPGASRGGVCATLRCESDTAFAAALVATVAAALLAASALASNNRSCSRSGGNGVSSASTVIACVTMGYQQCCGGTAMVGDRV